MVSVSEKQQRALLITAVLAAALIHVSIAVSQSVLGVGIGLMLVFRKRFEFTRIWLPLAIFFVLTLISLLLSPDPWGGHAQIRKFYVFLLIPLLYGVFSRQFPKVYYVMLGWTITATASGVWGLIQFYLKYHHSSVIGEDFYTAYVGARITGFERHWMTFSALQLSVLLLLLAQWFFSDKRLPHWAYLTIAVLAGAIVLAWTRGIWIAAVPSVLYLFWCWKPKMIWIAPVLAVAGFAISPSGTKDRLFSLVDPHGVTDSNEHRVITFRTGLEMIKSHPWFGLGPEQIGKQFENYVPADIPRPLPTGYYGHLHNIYIQYAAERGIAAMLVMMWLIGQMVWDCFRALGQLPPGQSQQRFVLHGAISVTAAVLIEGLFEFNLGDSEVLMMFISVLALAYAAIYNTDKKELRP
jgi:putative inorganic carbon (hco3(-)) transporter